MCILFSFVLAKYHCLNFFVVVFGRYYISLILFLSIKPLTMYYMYLENTVLVY